MTDAAVVATTTAAVVSAQAMFVEVAVVAATEKIRSTKSTQTQKEVLSPDN